MSKTVFYCSNCKLEFENDNPSKKEYTDYILGSCWKYVSNCPSCDWESDEKRVPKPKKSTLSMTSQSYCGGGSCDSCSVGNH